jgi:hypothetical protein
MVVYKLTCGTGHTFEGWYGSPEAFDRQSEAGHIDCPTCGALDVRKLPSAPYVKTGASAALPMPVDERRRALAALKTFLVSNTENVGKDFAEIARRIHYGEEKHRGIRGVVTIEEAGELLEEGVPAFPISPEIKVEEIH